jgi:CheY-like chemotaxis protein
MADTEQGGATVLVVDDEPGLVDLYVAFLEPEYDVRTATNGDEALQACDETVDVVLLDQRMPDMSGDEVLAELRQRNFDVRVAMLTAVEPDQDIVDMSFDDYKTKPVERSDLLSLVDTLLNSVS